MFACLQVVRALDIELDVSDLSNGMKFGQSTIYNSEKYSAEIRLFHRSGLESEEFSTTSCDTSGEHERKPMTYGAESPSYGSHVKPKNPGEGPF